LGAIIVLALGVIIAFVGILYFEDLFSEHPKATPTEQSLNTSTQVGLECQQETFVKSFDGEKSLKNKITISQTDRPQANKIATYLERNFMKNNMPVFFYGKPGMPIRYILESHPKNTKKVYWLVNIRDNMLERFQCYSQRAEWFIMEEPDKELCLVFPDLFIRQTKDDQITLDQRKIFENFVLNLPNPIWRAIFFESSYEGIKNVVQLANERKAADELIKFLCYLPEEHSYKSELLESWTTCKSEQQKKFLNKPGETANKDIKVMDERIGNLIKDSDEFEMYSYGDKVLPILGIDDSDTQISTIIQALEMVSVKKIDEAIKNDIIKEREDIRNINGDAKKSEENNQCY